MRWQMLNTAWSPEVKMQIPPSLMSLFVKIECNAHSSHRDPTGVYSVEVQSERTLVHSACAAIEIIKGHVAFLDENIDKAVVRVFRDNGSEVPIPVSVETKYHDSGSFRGRALDYPEEIIFQ